MAPRDRALCAGMTRVGLTGGYATGKSFVAAELERLGCRLIYADRLGHHVLLPGGEAYAATIEAFGISVLQADGTINRKALGEIVFNSPEQLQKLTGIVHPAVFQLEEQLFNQFEREDAEVIAVLEAAILIETGRQGLFEKMVLTTCDEETQIARGMQRDGITREQATARISRQMGLEEKKKFADFLIDTSGPKEHTTRQVEEMFSKLKGSKQNS